MKYSMLPLLAAFLAAPTLAAQSPISSAVNSYKTTSIEKAVAHNEENIKGVNATSVALSNLMQPYNLNTVSLTGSIGVYDTASAIAVGIGYRVTDIVAVQANTAYSPQTDEAVLGAGFIIEF